MTIPDQSIRLAISRAVVAGKLRACARRTGHTMSARALLNAADRYSSGSRRALDTLFGVSREEESF